MFNTQQPIHIKHIEVFHIGLSYQRSFHLSRGMAGTKDTKAPHIYLRMEMEDGSYGWGEARPSHFWSYETAESVVSVLRQYLIPALLGKTIIGLQQLHQIMNREIAPGLVIGHPIAKSAIDMAVYDYLAKQANVPLYRYLNPNAQSQPMSLIYTISAQTEEDAFNQVHHAMEQGYQGVKVKLGLGLQPDERIIRAVRKAAPVGFLWADANQAYSREEALQLGRMLADMGTDMMEQPIQADDFDAMVAFKKKISIPIALDESVFSPNILQHLIHLQTMDAVVVKISKLGGIFNAKQCIQMALDNGIKVLGSGLTESQLGMAAMAHLMMAFGITQYLDFNGPQFLAEDPALKPLVIKHASLLLSLQPGIGIEPYVTQFDAY